MVLNYLRNIVLQKKIIARYFQCTLKGETPLNPLRQGHSATGPSAGAVLPPPLPQATPQPVPSSNRGGVQPGRLQHCPGSFLAVVPPVPARLTLRQRGDLDLEAVLRELEAELSEDEEADEKSVEESDESEESDEAVEEAEEAKEDKETVDESEEDEETVDESEEAEETVDEADESNESEEITEEEEIDLEEVLRALQEEDEEDTTTEDMEKLQSELKEHRDVVKYLRSKLNEVNLLNAKLLFTNKLFRSYGLNNEQKMKVVETFDRAKSLREVKLVYSTMAESFGSQSTREVIVKESKKGSASKPVASTKSGKQEKEIISESDSMKQRFQKLANIL